jgi:glyoxylase-like metal-dependent hydrolase (beta-lactamase superfamily II)
MHVGAIEILPVIDATFAAPPSLIYSYAGRTEAEAWESQRHWLNDQGLLEQSMGGFLVRGAGDHITLVDLGLGENEMVGLSGGALLSSLATYGIGPEQITDVVFTHLHLDHIGWATKNNDLVFPNATYRCDAADWEFFVTDFNANESSPETSAYFAQGLEYFQLQRDLLLPVRDRLEAWSSDGPILPGLDAMRIPGHTPGSTIVIISDGGQRALLLGDVAHCPVELIDDEWACLADVDPELATRARNALVREIESQDLPVAAAHFPGLHFGRILHNEANRRFAYL